MQTENMIRKKVTYNEPILLYFSYEPELHPGVTYRLKPPLPKATLKIFSTGSVTVTGKVIIKSQVFSNKT